MCVYRPVCAWVCVALYRGDCTACPITSPLLRTSEIIFSPIFFTCHLSMLLPRFTSPSLSPCSSVSPSIFSHCNESPFYLLFLTPFPLSCFFCTWWDCWKMICFCHLWPSPVASARHCSIKHTHTHTERHDNNDSHTVYNTHMSIQAHTTYQF